MVQDPVCLMNIDERKPAATAVYKGKTYYFCSAGCKGGGHPGRHAAARS